MSKQVGMIVKLTSFIVSCLLILLILGSVDSNPNLLALKKVIETKFEI